MTIKLTFETVSATDKIVMSLPKKNTPFFVKQSLLASQQ